MAAYDVSHATCLARFVLGGVGAFGAILLVVGTCTPGSALAQVPAQRSLPPAAATTPPLRPPAQRPMRYRLRTGEVMIGTVLSEDSGSITVATSSGVVRIGRSNLVAVLPARGYPGRPMIISGAISFGVLYVLPMLAELAADEYEPLVLVPIAGPFILAYGCYRSFFYFEGWCTGVLTMWGIGQLVGLGLLIAGIVRRATASDYGPPVAKLEIWPVIARDYEGLALHMTF